MDPRQAVKPDPRRGLPSVDRLIREASGAASELPNWAVRAAAREAVEALRGELEAQGAAADTRGANAADGDVLGRTVADCLARAERLAKPSPRRVLNATGVVLHTNLGRAPLSRAAADAVQAAALSYSDLEMDLEQGGRGDRLAGVAQKLRLLSGAESAHVSNNNAAALLLVLDTLARDREVIVSRGELVEIGGSFRVPEIMQRAGVRLVEVGTTNRTHAEDYENAIGPQTALLLKVHRSNFEQKGFVAEVGLPALAAIGARAGLPVVDDLGSGTLVDLSDRGIPIEAFAPSRLTAGADVVCFSGDKLLGGPQAGILLGKQEIVERCRRNPLARALRPDKLGIAALDATLECLLDGRGEEEIPVLRRLLEPVASLEARARKLAGRLAKNHPAPLRFEVAKESAPVGGGSLPGFALETWVVEVSGAGSAERLAARLRRAETPVLARLRDGLLKIDLRTLEDDECAEVERMLDAALR